MLNNLISNYCYSCSRSWSSENANKSIGTLEVESRYTWRKHAYLVGKGLIQVDWASIYVT